MSTFLFETISLRSVPDEISLSLLLGGQCSSFSNLSDPRAVRESLMDEMSTCPE
ncbi:hypothetical protein Bpfe_020503, partial [Biomphalaria pfeifferi]